MKKLNKTSKRTDASWKCEVEKHNSYSLNAFNILAIAVIILGISSGFNSWKSYKMHNSLRSQITDMQQIVIENTKTINKLARISGAW